MTDWFVVMWRFYWFKSPFMPNAVSDVHGQLLAGNDLLMPGMPAQKKAIIENIKSNKLSQQSILIKRVLELVMKSPAMSNYNYSDKPNLKGNAEVTRVAAAEGIVLLKRRKRTSIYF
jgi:beta-glucosidase